MKSFKELTDYFQEIGAVDVGHSNKTYLAHAISVYNDLKKWGWTEEMARVGLFHSIYGTQLFQGFVLSLDRREEIRGQIGARPERIAWLNCVVDRPHFDLEIRKTQGPYQVLDRLSGDMVDVSDQDFDDLCTLHVCDWLEQVARSGAWDYRRAAFRGIAQRLGGVAWENYERVFSQAPEQTWFGEYDWPGHANRKTDQSAT